VDCTIDRCSKGKCTFWPDDDWCESNYLCRVGSTCDPEGGCSNGIPLECPQPESPSCYRKVCDPETGQCDKLELKNGADSDEDGVCDDNPLFGGDDCDDGDPDVHPGAEEVCNQVDDNCDGLADASALAGPVTIPAEGGVASPAVAFDGSRFAVIWQAGTSVQLMVLGTGACPTDTDCDAADSLAAIGPVDLTADGARAREPAIAGYDGRFSAVWVSAADGESPVVVQVGVEVGSDNASLEIDDPVVLFDATAADVSGPEIDWKGSEGWTAAWAAELDDGTYAVQATTEGGVPFSGEPSETEIGGLTISCFDGADCLVAYTREEAGDAEVFEARLEISGTSVDYRPGWPKRVSKASDLSGDPSEDPRIAWIGADEWMVSFTDTAVADVDVGPEEETDIRASRNGEVTALLAENQVNQQNVGLAFDGSRFAMAYLADEDGTTIFDVRFLDEGLSLYDSQLTRLGETATGTFLVAPLVYTGEGIAAAWAVEGELHFAHFTGCAPSAD